MPVLRRDFDVDLSWRRLLVILEQIKRVGGSRDVYEANNLPQQDLVSGPLEPLEAGVAAGLD